MRLAIVTTHPVQYYAPVFKLLNDRGNIDIMVFYTWGPMSVRKYDPGFGTTIQWDIPLLEGYPITWLHNASSNPGTHNFRGIINPDLISKVKDWKPDAVLVFGWAWQSHLKAIRYFKGKIPVYFRGDSTLINNSKGLKRLVKYVFLNWVYRHVDHGFYVGSNNKAYLKEYGFNDVRLSFTPHAVDNERFAMDRQDEATALRENLGIRDNQILILFAGKFEGKKSPQDLLNAFLLLQRSDLHLLFAGEGHLARELKSAAKGKPNVHFLNFQNQTFMPVLYQACDIFCLPSNGPNETWGLAVNEAMACSKPVLASDKIGCAVDLVKPGVNGTIFQGGNIEDLKRCLEQLTRSKSELKEMGRNSASIIKDWSFINIARAIEATLSQQYKNVCG
jgi:glycosyltransferase involved in cell wall biosynthesis